MAGNAAAAAAAAAAVAVAVAVADVAAADVADVGDVPTIVLFLCLRALSCGRPCTCASYSKGSISTILPSLERRLIFLFWACMITPWASLLIHPLACLHTPRTFW